MRDVLFYDAVGMPYTGETLRTEGLGGTEQNVVLLAEALVEQGLSVTVATKTLRGKTYNGVEYVPLRHAEDARTLVHLRYGDLPDVLFERRVLFCTDSVDISVGGYDKYGPEFRRNTDLVVVARWQEDLFAERGLKNWRSSHVIPGILPASVLAKKTGKPPKYPHRFVYASAARKGLRETLEVWRELEKTEKLPLDAELVITNPGYDAEEASRIFRSRGLVERAKFLGILPSMDAVADLLAESAGLFYVNTFAECTSITLAMCEALGRRVHMFCKNGFGGARDTVRSPLVTDDPQKFREDFLAALAKPEKKTSALEFKTTGHTSPWHGSPFDFSASSAARAWLPLVKPVYRQPGERVPAEIVSREMSKERDVSAIYDATFYATYMEEARRIPDYEIIAKALHHTFSFGSVIDVGCGPGLILDALQKMGHAVSGWDGSEHAIAAAPESVRAKIGRVDISDVTVCERVKSELVVCTEVAEHLPADRADHLVELLTSLGDTVFMTAAPPGQGGHDHINEQPKSYWIEKFARRGFELDEATVAALEPHFRELKHLTWCRTNGMVFRKQKSAAGLYGASWVADRIAESPGYRIVADAVHASFEFSTCVDLGCGPGALIARLQELGHRVEGFDGSDAARRAALVPVRPIDLTQPIVLDKDAKRYDLAICTEVAEHLEERFADTLVDSLCTVAGERILFSAATPGTLGVEHGHFNEQEHDYWIAKFRERGWFLSRPRSLWLRDRIREPLRTTQVPVAAHGTLLDWAPKNLMVFEKRATTALPNTDVAVIIPCRGQAKFLHECIASVRAQTRKPREIIVVAGDPESFEEAVAIVGQKNVVLDGGQGLANARNVGIAATTCELILPVDADDVLEPTCIEKMVAKVTEASRHSWDDRVIVASWMQEFGASAGQLRPTEEMVARGYTSPMCLFSRRLWELVGGYDVASPIEDWAFWLDCHKHQPILHLVPEPLVKRRMHPAQSTKVDPYELFMSVDRFLRPWFFDRTARDEENIQSKEIQEWVKRRREHFPGNVSLGSLERVWTPADTGVGLCMIVKNEKEVIERCLRSVRGLISHWTVVDTGSTDGTQEIVRKALEGIPGDLVERPWVDFSTNRNEALQLATGKTPYVLVIDADDVLTIPPGYRLPPLKADAYRIAVQHGEKRHYRPHIFRPQKFHYEGVLHEYLEGPVGDTRLDGLVMQIVGGGSRNTLSKTNKFVRDARILKEALEKDPTSTRNTFYLARSWQDAYVTGGNVDHLARALKVFQKRARMGGFEEEVYQSLLDAAKAHETLGHDRVIVTRAFLAAFSSRSFRAEPLFYLARYLRMKHSDYALAALYARHAAAMPKPTGEVLWVEDAIYDWWALDEFAVACSWIPALRPQCAEAARKLLEGRAPEGEYKRIRDMLKLCGG